MVTATAAGAPPPRGVDALRIAISLSRSVSFASAARLALAPRPLADACAFIASWS
jgi:hypothetical protein